MKTHSSTTAPSAGASSLRSAAAFAMMLLVAGCTGATGQPAAQQPPTGSSSPASIQQPSERSDPFRLPIDDHLLSEAQANDVDYARELLAYNCAVKLGFQLPSKPVRSAFQQGSSQIFNARRYGLVDPVVARESGYHVTRKALSSNANPVADPFAALTGAAQVAVFGPSNGQSRQTLTNPHGKQVTISQGGCLQSAVLTLTGGHDEYFETSPAAEKINFGSFSASQQDKRVIAAFKAWSSCMRSRGFSYPDPTAAINDKRWATPADTEAEVRVAVADVACKQQVKLVPTWNAVEISVQRAMVADQASALAAADQVLQRQVSLATAVIDGK